MKRLWTVLFLVGIFVLGACTQDSPELAATPDIPMETYTDETMGFSIVAPKGWTVSTYPAGGSGNVKWVDPTGEAQIAVTASEGDTLDDLVLVVRAMYGNKVEELSRNTVNENAVMIEFTAVISTSDLPNHTIAITDVLELAQERRLQEIELRGDVVIVTERSGATSWAMKEPAFDFVAFLREKRLIENLSVKNWVPIATQRSSSSDSSPLIPMDEMLVMAREGRIFTITISGEFLSIRTKENNRFRAMRPDGTSVLALLNDNGVDLSYPLGPRIIVADRPVFSEREVRGTWLLVLESKNQFLVEVLSQREGYQRFSSIFASSLASFTMLSPTEP